MDRLKLVTCYRINVERCLVIQDGRQVRRDLTGTWNDERKDSAGVRREILQLVAEQFGLVKPIPMKCITCDKVIPMHFADPNNLSLERPLPTARAKVILVRSFASPQELDECFEFEERLEQKFSDSEIGFVDGNDIGQGEFSVYVYGPRRSALLDVLQAVLQLDQRWRIRR